MKPVQEKIRMLQKAIERNNLLYAGHTRGCGRILPMEASEELNDSCREVILAMQEAYGEVYLGSINSGFHKKQPLVKYTGQELTNFICSFCVPVYHPILETKIYEWRNGNTKSLEQIAKLITWLGGKALPWS